MNKLSPKLQGFVCDTLSARAIIDVASVQSLWSGYGEILRIRLEGATVESIILKHISFPSENGEHPRGWNTDYSRQRKITSYGVESQWYKAYAQRCDDKCPVAQFYGVAKFDDEWVLLLEDLDVAGFPRRFQSLTIDGIKVVLDWLAHFHARFLNTEPEGLWPIGTYWHLDTRPEEYAAMIPGPLKNAAVLIDEILNQCQYKTLVHGDAKLANFCFSSDGQSVAAVDFQYVGAGCGMKDVAYFLGSCLDSRQCAQWNSVLLDYYFSILSKAVLQYHPPTDVVKLEQEWRQLFNYAWTDFYRFVSGWSPTHHKINDYTKQLANRVIEDLGLTINPK